MTDDLKTRLLATMADIGFGGMQLVQPRNPDGPEAVARIEVLEKALIDTAVHLSASLSILQRAHESKKQPRMVVASDTMFEQMLLDYAKSLERARTALHTINDKGNGE